MFSFERGVPEIGVAQNRITWEELQNQKVAQENFITNPLFNSYHINNSKNLQIEGLHSFSPTKKPLLVVFGS